MRHSKAIPAQAAAEVATLMAYSPLVIGLRVADFWLHAAQPTARLRREAELMVFEKVQAGVESAAALQSAFVRLSTEAAIAAMRARLPANPLRDLDRFAAAGLRPYARRVAANRKRLTRG